MQENWQSRRQKWILAFVGVLLLVSVGCSSNTQTTTETGDSAASNSAIENSTIMGVPGMENITNKHLTRVLGLMAPTSTGIELISADVLVGIDTIGALEGVGFLAQNPDVQVSVYAFETQAEHQSAFDMLLAAAPAENVETIYGSNGPVLFFGYTVNDGTNGDPIDAEVQLNTLAGAFAGEE